MKVSEAIKSRKSIRKYTGEPVSEEQLKTILFAAEASPVGRALYGNYHLTVITNKELLTALDKNAAQFFGNPEMHPLYGAPTLIVVSSCEEGNVASADAAMIIHNMALMAVELGVGHVDIYGVIAGMNANQELVAKLNLPDGFHALGAIAVGQTEEAYMEREIDTTRIATDYI